MSLHPVLWNSDRIRVRMRDDRSRASAMVWISVSDGGGADFLDKGISFLPGGDWTEAPNHRNVWHYVTDGTLEAEIGTLDEIQRHATMNAS